MDNVKQIDIEGVRERLECDDEFLVEIWTAFKEEVVKLEEDLSAAMAAGDLSLVEHHAHSLKGMSGNIGADTLQSIAYDMEQSARGGEIAQVKALYPALVEKINLVNVEIDELIA